MASATLRMPDGSEAILEYPDGTPEAVVMQKAGAAKQQWMAAHPDVAKATVEDKSPQNPEPARTLGDFVMDRVGGVVKSNAAVADVLSTAVSGVVGQVGGGIAGLLGTLLPGEENQGTRWKEGTESFLSKDLWTDDAKRAVGATAELVTKTKFIPKSDKSGKPGTTFGPFRTKYHLESLQEQNMGANARDTISAVSGGNPAIATAIETVARAAPEIFLGKLPKSAAVEGLVDIRKNQRILRQKYNDAAASAERNGYRLTNDELPESVVRVAENLAPETHLGANIDEVAASVKKAKGQMKDDVDDLYKRARAADAFTMVRPLQEVVEKVVDGLKVDGFRIGEMPKLQKHLDDFRALDKDMPEFGPPKADPVAGQMVRDLKTLDTMERSISLDLKGKSARLGNFTAEDAALLRLKGAVRKQLDNTFNVGAMSGDVGAVAAWKAARGAANKHRKLFKEDNLLRNMVAKDASAEDVYKWIVGSAAMHGRQQSAAVVRRLKEVLGDNHPSLVLIRHAAIRDALMPALQDVPNFGQAARNIEKLLNNNHTLVKELNIPVDKLLEFKRAARAAEDVGFRTEWMNKSALSKLASSIFFGHQISRRGRIVNFANKVFDSFLKTGEINRDKIIRHMIDLDTSQPLVTPKGPIWTEIMVRGAIADATDETEAEKAGHD